MMCCVIRARGCLWARRAPRPTWNTSIVKGLILISQTTLAAASLNVRRCECDRFHTSKFDELASQPPSSGAEGPWFVTGPLGLLRDPGRPALGVSGFLSSCPRGRGGKNQSQSETPSSSPYSPQISFTEKELKSFTSPPPIHPASPTPHPSRGRAFSENSLNTHTRSFKSR